MAFSGATIAGSWLNDPVALPGLETMPSTEELQSLQQQKVFSGLP